ncbi:hypothetical protein LEP1GSC193_4265 [Leptospira alstonii serovar Pingchang str. 80-412]|uniref:Uncharacterized protein n=2 Tax=Leptospira alstonii serovar Pingchang str. 80-412 TaxID=1218564 RepID=T0FWS7_9LEPT|nr:hypothetical protein LEP1GSC193_4265 [Leptospira alstonii serovar Pingchang str. 80-412]
MLIRANRERKIEGGGCSWSYLETLEPADTYTITVPRKKGRRRGKQQSNFDLKS